MKTRGSSAKRSAYLAAALFIPGLLLFALVHKGERGARRKAGEQAPVSASTPRANPELSHAQIAEAYGKLPLAFEKNLGQTNPQVQYLSHGQGYELFLTPKEAVLSLRHARAIKASPANRIAYARAVREANQTAKTSVVRMQFVGGNPEAEVTGLNKLARKTDYFVGNNPKDWRTDVPSYSRVEYRGVYPGVDAIFYGNQSRLEYDFVVAPGADPRTIALNVEGTRNLRVDARGNLVMSIEQGTMELKKPAVYQMVNGERREVAGNYVLRGKDRVAFDVAGYDPGQALIIDPVLDYSTYLGGSSSTTAGDIAYGIAVDASGDAYVTGLTYSTPFPTSSSPATIEGYQAATAAGAAVANGTAFVSEIDPTGTTELYFSYLSGSTSEAGYGIAVDPAPNANCPNGVAPGICVYVTGYTASTDFPVTSGANAAFDPGPPTGSYTGFISKLNPAASGASSLVYSSYLGGSAGDSGNAIAVDANQVAYVAGITTSSPGAAPDDFVLVNPYQNTLNSSSGNAFLVKVDTTAGAGALKYATYLGGSGVNSGTLGFGDGAFGVAVDSSQNAYIVGTTSSTDFPTIGNAVEATAPTGNTQGTAFVSRIDTTQTGNPSPSLIYSTYLGGSVKEHGDAIALGPNNVVYVTGASSSTSTTGTGSPTPFPVTTGAYQTTGSPAGVVFVSLIDTNAVSPASSLKYSTLLGGSGADEGFGIKADSLGNAYVAGVAQSAGAPPSGFPTTPGAYQTTRPNVLGDVFVAKLDPAGNGSADLLYSSYFGGSGSASGIQDQAYAVAIDLAGNAYLAGQTASADFPIYPASAFQSSFVTGNLYGFAAKLTLEPTVAISPLTIPFGNQAEGIASAPQTVTLTNNTSSAAAITLPLAAITGANAGDFSATPAASGSTAACTSSLAAGSSCAIEVTFTPSITGTLESGTLSITYTAGASSNPAFTQTIGLSGTGIVVAPGATVMPASPLTFSGQLVTTTSAAQPVTVTNSGNSDLPFRQRRRSAGPIVAISPSAARPARRARR